MSAENPPSNPSKDDKLEQNLESHPSQVPEEHAEKIEKVEKMREEFRNMRVEDIDAERSAEVLQQTQIHGDEYDGKFLTKETLLKEGLSPTKKVQIDDSAVWFSSEAYEMGGRLAVMAYVEKEGKITACSYYRSNSQGVWRYMPDYETDSQGEINWFGKGWSEESTTVPIAMQKVLSGMNIQNSIEVSSPRAAKSIFAGTAEKYGKWQGPYYKEIDQKPTRLEGDFYSTDDDKKTPPENVLLSENQSPDFSEPLTTWKQETSTYGEVTVEVFPSKDGNLKYMFYKDSEGRAWIGGIEDESELQSTGLRKSWVEGGDLTTPAYEYFTGKTDQTGGYGNESKRSGQYVDMYENYLSKIPVIKEYVATGAAREAKKKLEQENAFKLNETKDQQGITPENTELFSDDEMDALASKLNAEAEKLKVSKEASDKKDAEKLAEVKERLEKNSEKESKPKENKEKEQSPKSKKSEKKESPEKKKSWGEKSTKEKIQTVGKYGAVGVGGLAVAGIGGWTAATIAGYALAPLAATPVFGAAAGFAGFTGFAALLGAGLGDWFGMIAIQELFKAYKAAGGIGGIFKFGGGKGGGGAAPKKAAGGGGHGGGGGGHH